MNQVASQNTPRQKAIALVEEELVSSVVWFVRIRWLAGFGVLAATWFATAVLNVPLPAASLYAIGIAILLYNAIFHVVLQQLLRAKPLRISQFDYLTKAQIGLDWLAMTALIHFSGGVESPVIFYFFFHIIIAAILLSPRATLFFAAMATLLVSGTIWLECAGVLSHIHPFGAADAALHGNPVFIFGVIFFFTSATFVAAYFASTLSSRLLGKREAEVVVLSQQLERAYRRLETLYQAAQATSSTLELQQVLDRLVRSTTEAMGVQGCSIWLLDEKGTRLTLGAVHGLSKVFVKKGDLVLERNTMAREVLAGKVIAIGDVVTETRLQYHAEAIAEGIRSMLSARLITKRGPCGLIRAYSTERNRFTEEDAAFLSAIANQSSIAIENALAYQTLSKLDQMKSKFVLMVTHELRSPVSVVRSLLRTLSAGYAGSLTETQTDMAARAAPHGFLANAD